MFGDRMLNSPGIGREGSVSWTIDRVRSDRDLDEVLAIEAASFSNPWNREMYEHELENPDVCFLYALRLSEPSGGPQADRPIVGFCSVWLVLDELHINNLAVHPRYRQSGYGSALLQYVLDVGAQQGARRAMLEVRRSNEVAIRVYERFGFKIAATRPNYYTSPTEDAFILWRQEEPRAVDSRAPSSQT